LGFLPLLLTAYAPSAVAQGSDPTQQQPQEPAVTVLVGAKKVPPPPPPAPSGAPPAPRIPPPSYYDPVGPFSSSVETLTSANTAKYGVAATPPCVQSGVFKRGMRIVFRFEILDTSTGKRVTDRDGATVKLRLPHGEEIPARWAIRGAAAALPDSAWMWDAAWDI